MFIFLPPKCWYKLTELTSTESMKTQFTFGQKRRGGGNKSSIRFNSDSILSFEVANVAAL